MSLILGIDPGSLITGYGLISLESQKIIYIDSGCIRTGGGTMAHRIKVLYESIRTLMLQYSPEEVAVEKVFMHTNPDSALKLGQARGAVIAALVQEDRLIHEYTPREVKLAVVGYGAADKKQVQQMVKKLLKLNRIPQADAADALAIALCHSHSRKNKLALLKGKKL